MHLIPDDIFQSLEFDKVLKLAESYCYGEAGRAYFQGLSPSTSFEEIENWLNQVYEYTQISENNHHFPVAAYQGIDEELNMLQQTMQLKEYYIFLDIILAQVVEFK